MRKLVLVVIALLALFALFRAYSDGNGSAIGGIRLQPGLFETGDGSSSLGLSFGLMEKSVSPRRLVSVLPPDSLSKR